MFGMFGQMMGRLQQPLPQDAGKPKGGMFGGGDWKSALAAALAGFSAGGGNPAGQMALQMLHQRLGQKREDQQYQVRRKDALADYAEKQKIEAQYARPQISDFERKAMFAGVQPGTPEFVAAAKQAWQNEINPFQVITRQNPDGSEVREFMRPPQIPTAPVGGLTPIEDEDGGPRPLGVGGFPGW